MREGDHEGQRHQMQAAHREPLRGVGSGEKRYFQLTASVGGVETTQRHVAAPETQLREAGEAQGARCSLSAPRDDSAVPRCRGRVAGALAPTSFLRSHSSRHGRGRGRGLPPVLSGGHMCDSQRLCPQQAQVRVQVLGL